MRKYNWVLLATFLTVTHAASAKEQLPTSIVLSGDHVITGKVGEMPISLKVDAATPDRPVLNPEFIEKAEIGKSLIGGLFRVGPVRISASTKVIKYQFDDLEWKRRSVWTDRAYTNEYDGGVGPGGIPYDIVTLSLRPKQPGEQVYSLPLTSNGNSMFELEIDGKTIDVTFTQKRDRTLATAAAGALIAAKHGGIFTGKSETTEIAYGVERPIRALQLSEPLNIIGLSLDGFFVRTKDDGDSSNIIDSEAANDADGSEIVVIGKKGKKDKNRYSITLGRDDLSHCSSIIYDKPAKKIRLSCVSQ